MSVALSTDRKQESTENAMGAPDIAGQQKLEHKAATSSSSTGQKHAEGGSGQNQQQHQQQNGESESGQQQTKS